MTRQVQWKPTIEHDDGVGRRHHLTYDPRTGEVGQESYSANDRCRSADLWFGRILVWELPWGVSASELSETVDALADELSELDRGYSIRDGWGVLDSHAAEVYEVVAAELAHMYQRYQLVDALEWFADSDLPGAESLGEFERQLRALEPDPNLVFYNVEGLFGEAKEVQHVQNS